MTLQLFEPVQCDLSIIIVNWNTREQLADTLLSLSEKGEGLVSEVILLDCASGDGSANMVEKRFPHVRLIRSSTNLGFARGNNVAIRSAAGKIILLLNPDTIVHDNALEAMWGALEEFPKLGIVGAQLLNRDGSRQLSYGPFPSLQSEIPVLNRIDVMGLQSALRQRGIAENGLVTVDWVSGACLMTRREIFEVVGLLDEAFWLYTEEADFCYRVQKAGWGVATAPAARITHIGQAASRQRYRETMLYFYQSRVRFVAKHQGSVAAKLVKVILAAKAQVWQRMPSRSPLQRAYGALLEEGEIRDAYRQLFSLMTMPVEKLLSCTWE